MGLSDFRSLFSKASVVIDKKKIIVAFTDKELWVHQLFNTESVGMLRNIIDKSDGFSIKISPNKSITISFMIDSEINQAVVYPPLEKQIDIGDITTLSYMVSNPGEYFREFIETEGAGKDVDDEFISSLLDFVKSKEPPKFVSVQGLSNWKLFKSGISEFTTLCGASEIRVSDYNEDFDGCVEFSFYDSDTPVSYLNDRKASFLKALDVSKELEFELSVRDGYLNITLFA